MSTFEMDSFAIYADPRPYTSPSVVRYKESPFLSVASSYTYDEQERIVPLTPGSVRKATPNYARTPLANILDMYSSPLFEEASETVTASPAKDGPLLRAIMLR
ncbi:mdh [Acrasis kona]|uniref:Mdh n=1 Tax=Acrasis kona TaxID=1008807 RepID=A0AAW2YTF7_9EUKA